VSQGFLVVPPNWAFNMSNTGILFFSNTPNACCPIPASWAPFENKFTKWVNVSILLVDRSAVVTKVFKVSSVGVTPFW
jgi:hypothetical protein